MSNIDPEWLSLNRDVGGNPGCGFSIIVLLILFVLIPFSLKCCVSCGEDTYEKGYETGKTAGEQDGYWKQYHGEWYNNKSSLFNDNPSQEWLNGFEQGYETSYWNEVKHWQDVQNAAQ